MSNTIKIDNKNYKVKFSYGSLKSLAKHYKCKKLSGLGEVFAKLDFKENQEPSIDQLDTIAIIVFAGVENANKTIDLPFDADGVMDVLMVNPDKMSELLELFTESMVNVSGSEGKPQGDQKKK